MKKITLTLLMIVLLVSCDGETPRSNFVKSDEMEDFTIVSDGPYTEVYRVVDTEAGVVCWIYWGIEKGGIDCMPLSETSLRVGE